MKVPFMRSAYNYDVEKASNEAMIPADQQGESLTVQSMAEDADINVLMHRFGVTGKFPDNPRMPSFGDFSGITDFRSALEAVAVAQANFMELPADMRSRFGNDPQKLLEFVSSDLNRDEAIKLGLLSEAAVKARSAAIAAETASRQAELIAAARAAGMVIQEAPKEAPDIT